MRRSLVLPTALLMLAAGGVGACGEEESESSSGGGKANVAEAKAIVKELEAPVKFEAPGPAIDVGAELEGKTIFMVVKQAEYQFVQNIVDGVEEASSDIGMKFVLGDAAGQVAKAVALIERAIAQKADVIVTQAFDTESLSAALQEAQDAGIPVIEVTGRDAGLPSEKLRNIGVSAIASYCYSCAGEQLAAAAVAKHDGDVNAVIVDSPDFGTSNAVLEGIKAGFERLCPSCELTYKSSPSAQWKQLDSLASSSLQESPDANVLLPVFDEMGLLMKPGVLRSGAGDKVDMISWAATLGAMQDLERGELFEANVGASQAWLGWAIVDQAVRLATGNEPAESENIPHRLFTDENIDEVDLDAPESWYGSVDFRAEYKRLWGTE